MILSACCQVFQGWGRSSAGRAPALQAGGHRFDPDRLHHRRLLGKRRSLAKYWFVSRMIEFGLITCLGKASRVVCSCRIMPLGLARGCCPVGWRCSLLHCESGSGASLGACDRNQSVWAGRDPVVRLTCLTGNCCSQERRPNGRRRGFRGVVNDIAGWIFLSETA